MNKVFLFNLPKTKLVDNNPLLIKLSIRFSESLISKEFKYPKPPKTPSYVQSSC